jgi:hypothetical protein
MKFSQIKNRINDLEGKKSPDTVTLRFADNSERTIHVPGKGQRQKNCELICAAMDRLNSAGHPEEPRAVSRFDKTIELLGRAESIDPPSRFLETVAGICTQALEGEAKKSDATPEVPKAQSTET